jgi:VCBS repeat-containing protein
VAPVNDAPVAASDSATVTEDLATVLAVLGNDAGLGDAPLVVTITVPPQHGSVTVNADGTVRYTPDPNYNGPDRYSYEVHDVDGETSGGTVFITVRGVNDAPVAVADRLTLIRSR